ncbi:MAG TPA: hypothetical protein DCX54_07350 [Flavobacteriales bacterium]|nr:hypothetical protein [Flavobacteriales bacterium]
MHFSIMKLNKIFTIAISLGAFALISSCKGPEGPAGPAGPAGADGADGTDGTPGVAGNAVCMECHNATKNAAITAQWAASTHGLGEVAHSRGGSKSCAMCHSDQGFRETQYTGQDTMIDNSGLPQAIQCGTCHDFHQSLDFENEPNYALRTMGPVDLLMYRAADPGADPVTLDLGDESNLCANCHQPRRVGPDLTADSAYVSSSHYGPHHGPQATSLAGLGASEVGTGYPAPGTGSTHVTSSTCVTCHMHDGEHTWEPSLTSCNTEACHNGALTSVTDNTRQLAFATSMATLEAKLTTAGLLLDGHPNPGTYPADQVGALYNYEWLVDDRSNGVHNFPYLERMLANSIAVF